MYFKEIPMWEAHRNYSNTEQMPPAVIVVNIIAIITPGVSHSLEECSIQSVTN